MSDVRQVKVTGRPPALTLEQLKRCQAEREKRIAGERAASTRDLAIACRVSQATIRNAARGLHVKHYVVAMRIRRAIALCVEIIPANNCR